MGMRGGNSGGSSSIESKWEAAMEAELGEMDADGRSERPPYAPRKKRMRAKLRTRKAILWQDRSASAASRHPACPVCTGRVHRLKCWILLLQAQTLDFFPQQLLIYVSHNAQRLQLVQGGPRIYECLFF